MNKMNKKFFLLTGLLMIIIVPSAFAHCDTMDGPVVFAAKEALVTKNVNHVLIWVQPTQEKEVIVAFEAAINDPDKEYDFFATLVRVHREGEGAEFEGLKPAGVVEPIVQLSDQAIEQNDVAIVLDPLTKTLQQSITEQFQELQAKKDFSPDDVEAGREYVEHYVTFMHNVEGIDVTLHGSGHVHEGESHEESEGRIPIYISWIGAGIVVISGIVFGIRKKK